MLAYTLKRILLMIPTLLGVAVLVMRPLGGGSSFSRRGRALIE